MFGLEPGAAGVWGGLGTGPLQWACEGGGRRARSGTVVVGMKAAVKKRPEGSHLWAAQLCGGGQVGRPGAELVGSSFLALV